MQLSNSGILHNDRIYEVGRVNVTNKTHAEVVDLIKASEAQTGKIELLVVDEELDEYYRKNAIKGTVSKFFNLEVANCIYSDLKFLDS